jgi:hypothetical protein
MPSDENQPVMSTKGADWPGIPITAFNARVFNERKCISRMINTKLAVAAAMASATMRPTLIVLFPF